jgi:hypothetical protein
MANRQLNLVIDAVAFDASFLANASNSHHDCRQRVEISLRQLGRIILPAASSDRISTVDIGKIQAFLAMPYHWVRAALAICADFSYPICGESAGTSMSEHVLLARMPTIELW